MFALTFHVKDSSFENWVAKWDIVIQNLCFTSGFRLVCDILDLHKFMLSLLDSSVLGIGLYLLDISSLNFVLIMLLTFFFLGS